ncbi:MAG: tRNA-specific adenosine deaminase [Methanoregulaceae archaeon PtaU1.Bin059]|jgi:cytosine deaminase|nr:MAG: tRNA-specific adenosine deaminase [Methanoregulaceae archaeon PtaU1.Bin059]
MEYMKDKMHHRWMDCAVAEARAGLSEGGIPIGSVLVRDGQILGRGHNRRVQEGNPILHAEIDCLQNAGRVGSFRNCVLYSTLMPCYLCAGAAVQFGIPVVVAGESENFPGARDLLEAKGVQVIDLHREDCISMMKEFITRCPELWNEDIGEL